MQVPQAASSTLDGRLRSVSIGGPSGTQVWALDNGNRLYIRKEVTVVFPEGAAWHQVATDVKSISASESGELWAVLDRVAPDSVVVGLVGALVGGAAAAAGADQAVAGMASDARGVLVRRSGMTPGRVMGTGWDIALGVSHINLTSLIIYMLTRVGITGRLEARVRAGQKEEPIGTSPHVAKQPRTRVSIIGFVPVSLFSNVVLSPSSIFRSSNPCDTCLL